MTDRICDCHVCVGEEQAKAWGVLCGDKIRVQQPPSRFLLEPLQPILEQRGKEYGDYVEMCARIQAIKDGMCPHRRDGQPHLHTMQVEALEMIATKIGRILTGNPDNEDSWRDIAGYATLVADRIPKQPKIDGRTLLQVPHGWSVTGHNQYKGPVNQLFTGTLDQLYDLIERGNHQ